MIMMNTGNGNGPEIEKMSGVIVLGVGLYFLWLA
jgi:hypothetical protein